MFWQKDDEVINTGKVNINEEFVSESKGNVITALTTKSPLMMPDGTQGLVGVIQDIIESKRSEALLKATDALKQTILDSSKYAIISADLSNDRNGMM